MAMNTNYFGPPLNMDRICRICLLEGTNLTPIFCTEQEVDEFSGLSQKIQVCGSIDIHENDGFPSLICDVCIYKASIAHEFRQQCQQSDARLRLLYDKPAGANIADSCTQTEPQTRIILTSKIPSPRTTYYVKQELQPSNTQDYASAIEEYARNAPTGTVGRVSENPIDCQDEKIFLCDIGFVGAKEITDKEAETLAEAAANEATVVCPIPQTEITAGLLSVDENGRLETRRLIVKNDAEKCSSTEIADEYIKEQMMNETTMGESIAADEEDFEEQQQEELLRQQQQLQQQERNEARSLKRASLRKIKSASYSEDQIHDDDYFATVTVDQRSDQRPKYKCSVCLKRYMTQKGLRNHAQVHERNHKCAICHKTFFKLKNMEKHARIHDTRMHACKTCHASFAKISSLARHARIHVEAKFNDDDTAKLREINEATTTSTMIEIRKNDELSDLGSDEDDEIAVMPDPLTNEIDEYGNELYRCEICKQYCSSMKNLKRHSLVHGEKKYSCTVCKKCFFRPDTLKRHAEKHGHGLLDNIIDDDKFFDSDDDHFSNTATIMQDSSSSEIATKAPITTAATTATATTRTTTKSSSRDDSEDDSIGEYKCQHCDKVMATKKGLRRHVSMHKPKAEPVTCEICKKLCASQARLALHLKTHNKPKEKVPREYLCHICSKVYPSNSSLTYHMRTHTGVKPHVCKICNSGFTTTTSLANHIRIHTGDKPFVCHVCNAAFAVSSAYRRHLTRHTGEANYLCKTCGKAFKRLSTLKEHTYTHSGEKPYVCKTCGAAYSHSGSLFAHQKRCRAQYGEMIEDHNVAHHIHVNNVQTAVRSLAVIGQMY